MGTSISIADVLGIVQVLDLEELDTDEILPARGGVLIIKLLNDYTPPLTCTQIGCYELADALVISVNRDDEDGDMTCQVCTEHLNMLRHLVTCEVPMRLVN